MAAMIERLLPYLGRFAARSALKTDQFVRLTVFRSIDASGAAQ
jgi:hypothetical protein